MVKSHLKDLFGLLNFSALHKHKQISNSVTKQALIYRLSRNVM